MLLENPNFKGKNFVEFASQGETFQEIEFFLQAFNAVMSISNISKVKILLCFGYLMFKVVVLSKLLKKFLIPSQMMYL
jgi:hypothetical protein